MKSPHGGVISKGHNTMYLVIFMNSAEHIEL